MVNTREALSARMADGTTVVINRLLGKGDSNVKLAKSEKSGKGIMTLGLSLAPAMSSGFQVCGSASDGCIKACIYTSGFGGFFPSIPAARIAKTRAFFQNRQAFVAMLIREIGNGLKRAKAKRKRLAVRLNVFSDLPWEKLVPELFALFPTVQFYDYTKHTLRAIAHAKGQLPSNYHLTYSRSEVNEADAIAVLTIGGSVAVVFDKKQLPTTWQGFEVINGDETDLRFLDKRGVVVGLYAKGKGKKDDTGFVVKTDRVPLTVV